MPNEQTRATIGLRYVMVPRVEPGEASALYTALRALVELHDDVPRPFQHCEPDDGNGMCDDCRAQDVAFTSVLVEARCILRRAEIRE